MFYMNTPFNVIAPEFGVRLREERARLALTQAELANRAGVQRLTQSQYESETRVPNIRYLSAVGAAGVNLYYLLFGKKSAESASSQHVDERRIEQQVFSLIEDYVRVRCGGQLSAEGRFVLFEVMRAHLIHATQVGTSADLNIDNLLDIKEGGIERSGA